MGGVREVRCSCCGLNQLVPSSVGTHRSHAVCLRCVRHLGDTAEALTTARSDHARLYQEALDEAQDEVLLAQGERDLYRRRMQAAHRERERLVRVLAEIAAEHGPSAAADRCGCGLDDCRTRPLLDDPQVAPLVANYDEHQRSLRELQRANPGVWTDKLDYIDITLVYPDAGRRPGRHRAAG